MTTSKKWLTICVAAGLIAACTLAAPPGAGAALTEKNSGDFDWKYEMTVKPSAENLDGHGGNDFMEGTNSGGSASASVADGILKIASSRDDQLYYNSTDADHLWPHQVFNLADGYTFEIGMKIVGVSTGALGSLVVYPSPSDSQEHAYLNIAHNKTSWGDWATGVTTLSTVANNDDFHVFRVAQEYDSVNTVGVYHVWRDGDLLTPEGGCSSGWTYDINRMVLGDAGTRQGTADSNPEDEIDEGWVEVDYFRFTEGAYAPEGGSPPIPGDANLDDIVNDADASILAAHWQQTGMGWGDGDFNDDQIVNDADASILAAHWQETQEGGVPVPEPSTLVLLGGIGLLGLVGLARRRR